MVTAPSVDERSPHARAARVLAAVVLAYLVGAALAAWAGSAAAWLLVPVAVLAATALATHRRLAEEPWDADIRPPACGPGAQAEPERGRVPVKRTVSGSA